MGTHQTFCTICEALCGMEIEVEDGKVVKIRPDAEHPVTRGKSCPKGIAMIDVVNDPDRVTRPMQRQADGSFVAVSWEVALEDIGRRLNAVIDRHGKTAVGTYLGNSAAFNYGAFFWGAGLCDALGTKHNYSAASLDINNYWASASMLYGNPLTNPIPDINRTDFLLVLGANPAVSGGSMVTMTPARERLKLITARGGRIVVVDPRNTETAKLGEHIGIKADTDPYLLLAMLQTIFAEGLQDDARLAEQATGVPFLRRLVQDWTPERAEAFTGIPAERTRALARDFATARSASSYGRCGISLGRTSTLTIFLLQCLNVVTGNLDRPGGAVFGDPLIDIEDVAHKLKLTTYDTWRTRVDGFPELLGSSPSATMAREITTPGEGQLRALICCCGNPAQMVPDAPGMQAALEQLDLLVTIDLYITETGRLADYVLPGTAWMERDSYAWLDGPHHVTPHGQWSPKAVDPPGECREEWWTLDQISRRIGVVPSAAPAVRALGRLGIRLPADVSFDLFLRLGKHGDLFGLRRSGWSRKKLWARPRGVSLGDNCPTGVLRKRLVHKDKRVHLEHAAIAEELQRLEAMPAPDPAYPLRMFTLRELRSFNTWMHNVPKLLAPDRRQQARLHPEDAARHDFADGDRIRIASAHGAITVEVKLSDDITPGNIAVPHGWGHKGGWKVANATVGANYNDLVPSDRDLQDRLSGNARFNGIPVRLERVEQLEDAAEPAPAHVI